MSDGYTPLFQSLSTGTLCGRWPDIGLWGVVLSLANKHGEVDATVTYLAKVTGLSPPEVAACMRRFCEPDPESRSREEEGRRLVPIDPENRDWGWRVVNHAAYRERARLKAKNEREVTSGQNARRLAAQTAEDRRPPPRTAAHPLSNANANKRKDMYGGQEAAPSANPQGAEQPDGGAETGEDVPRQTASLGGLLVAHGALDPWMLEFREIYPKRAGDPNWRGAWRAARSRIREGHKPEEFLAGARRYAEFIRVKGDAGTDFVQQASTFLGQRKAFLLAWDPPKAPETSPQRQQREARERHDAADAREWQQLRTRAIAIDFRAPADGESIGAFRTVLERAEYDARYGAGGAPKAGRG